MLLCLDVGNSHFYGGIFHDNDLSFQFRYPSNRSCTSDELGLFLKTYLREMAIDQNKIAAVATCSVVPSLDYSVRSAFLKYFKLDPFVLQAGVKTGLQIKYKNPTEVGADRIANAIGAHSHYPNHNIIIVDLGSATSLEVIAKDGTFLGGAILPGIQMQMRSLNEHTANLPPVRITRTQSPIGQSTTSNIQSGLYYGKKGAIRELINEITQTAFQGEKPIVIGTGGFSHIFEEDNLFDSVLPDLVLQGLRIAYLKNR